MYEKLMPEYRKQLGTFEALEVVDEEQIAAIRSQLEVHVPMELQWTWDYASEVEELRHLYERGKSGQWNAETDIDWSLPFPRDEWFMPKRNALLLPTVLGFMGVDDDTCLRAAHEEFGYMLSQLLHGEQAALQLCGQLTNVCPNIDAKFYAGSQVIDEVRHVEVISKFLQRKLGTIYPVSPTLKILLDSLLAAPTWKTKTLGMQTLFEGVAVGILDMIGKVTLNPLLKDIVRRVQLDEARHAAFGVLCMRQVVRESNEDELRGMEDFAFGILEAFNANQNLDMLRLIGPRYGLDPDVVVEMVLQWPEWPAVNSELFMHTVIPNLMRLGLVSERTEPSYRKLGILFGERFGPRGGAATAN